MKYLKHFESFSTENSAESVEDIISQEPEIITKSEDYLNSMSDEQKAQLKVDLEKFASEHGVNFEDLEDPELVKKLLTSHTNESFGEWFKKNWYMLVDKIARYTGIAALVTFVGTLGAYYTFGYDNINLIKVAAAAWIISQAVGTLRGLK